MKSGERGTISRANSTVGTVHVINSAAGTVHSSEVEVDVGDGRRLLLGICFGVDGCIYCFLQGSEVLRPIAEQLLQLVVPCDDGGDVDLLRKIRHGAAVPRIGRVIPRVMDLSPLLDLRLGEGL